MASSRLFRTLAAFSGIFGQAALGVYYSVALVPAALAAGTATPSQLVAIAASHRDAIFLDAWLQAVGALLSVVYFVALVYMANAEGRFAGVMTIMASSVLLMVALTDATFTLEAVQAATIGHTETALVAFDFIGGAGEVFDYAFLFIPAPFVIISLGAVLRGSDVLPTIFAYLAFLLGGAFVILGLTSLFVSLTGRAGVVFESIQLCQVAWVVASAVAFIFRGRRNP